MRVCGHAGGLAKGVRSAFFKLAEQYDNKDPEQAGGDGPQSTSLMSGVPLYYVVYMYKYRLIFSTICGGPAFLFGGQAARKPAVTNFYAEHVLQPEISQLCFPNMVPLKIIVVGDGASSHNPATGPAK